MPDEFRYSVGHEVTDDEMVSDAALGVNENALKSIAAVVAEYDALMTEHNAISARDDEIVNQLTHLKTKTLPELLAAAGTSSFTDQATGRVVDLSLMVTGSLSKDVTRRAEQLEYVKGLGGEALVKVKLTVNFERGEIEEARRMEAQLKAACYTPFVSEDIHAQTLMAWGRERIQNGMELEPEKAGLYVANVAVPHEPKVVRVKTRGKK